MNVAHDLERQLVCEEFEHDAAHAPHVALRTTAALPDLWRHCRRCACHLAPSHAENASAANLCNAQVAYNDMRLLREHVALVPLCSVEQQQVLTLQVLVHHPLLVDVHQRCKTLAHCRGCPLLWHYLTPFPGFAHKLEELPAFAMLHHDVHRIPFLVPREDTQDVRMVEILQDLSLHLEALVIPAIRAHNGLHNAGLPGLLLRHSVHHTIRPLPQHLRRLEVIESELRGLVVHQTAAQGLGAPHVRHGCVPRLSPHGACGSVRTCISVMAWSRRASLLPCWGWRSPQATLKA
mmetsp:Transcript_82742/g.208237  ORF Transcript_82742/g.208237 Transcript_82742/m.208237 type:complete len:292 (-) Transcript_82742:8-883(-)